MFDYDTKITDNITLIAKFDKIINKYQVSFKSLGESLLVSEVIEGEKVSELKEIEKDGYTFIGWYLDNILFDFNTPILKDIKLEAKFEKILNKYNVNFLVDGKTYKSSIVTEGNTVSEPIDPFKEGHLFVNWEFESNIFNFETLITKDINLVAVFEEHIIEEIKQVYIGENWFNVEDIKNKVLPYSQAEIKIPDIYSEGGLAIYDIEGFNNIVKSTWEDIGYEGAVFVIDSLTGKIKEGFYRSGNPILNKDNPNSLASKSGQVVDPNYGSQNIPVLDGQYYIVLHKSYKHFNKL